jgi:hypothetical protein
VAPQFFSSSLEDLHLAAWAATTFTSSSTMTQEAGQLAAATTQVKLCLYNEHEPVYAVEINVVVAKST